jgi:hypothetical protein
MRRVASGPDDRCVAWLSDTLIAGSGADGGTHACAFAPWGKRGLAQDRPVRRVPGRGRHALAFEVLNRTASAHYIGSILIAGTAETGAADPCRRIFGYLGLHVIPRA